MMKRNRRKNAKKRSKLYMVVSENNYCYGAFPFTPEGKSKALSYMKKITPTTKEKLKIVP